MLDWLNVLMCGCLNDSNEMLKLKLAYRPQGAVDREFRYRWAPEGPHGPPRAPMPPRGPPRARKGVYYTQVFESTPDASKRNDFNTKSLRK